MPRAQQAVLRLASSISGLPDGLKAAGAVAAQCGEVLGDGPIDLAMLFITGAHASDAPRIAHRVREALSPECLVGVSGAGVVGGRLEIEKTPGISLVAMRLPGVVLKPFFSDELLPFQEDSQESVDRIAQAIGADPSLRASVLFADPFSTPMARLLPALNQARGGFGHLVGGMASAGAQPGTNALILNDRVTRAGLVGVSLKGRIDVETVVSQGCRGIGPNCVITAAQKNVILKLGGRPALDVVRELVEHMPDEDRPLLDKGLFVGRVVNEYKDRFGRDDYLIRNVIGVEESQNAILINEAARIGTTIRFHVRDAKTASEDLALLLDAQQLKDPPAGGLLFSCSGRGADFFGHPNHDASAVVRAFSPDVPAEARAKSGSAISADLPGASLPLAGFHAAGEIGPVGGESYIHGFSACLTLFREDR